MSTLFMEYLRFCVFDSKEKKFGKRMLRIPQSLFMLYIKTNRHRAYYCLMTSLFFSRVGKPASVDGHLMTWYQYFSRMSKKALTTTKSLKL